MTHNAKTQIGVTVETRAKLASLGRKDQTYDEIIQELLKAKTTEGQA